MKYFRHLGIEIVGVKKPKVNNSMSIQQVYVKKKNKTKTRNFEKTSIASILKQSTNVIKKLCILHYPQTSPT